MIGDHVVHAMAAGLIPVPLLEIGAVTLVQLDMGKKLADLYDARYEVHWGTDTIERLRRMRDEGTLSGDEFERL